VKLSQVIKELPNHNYLKVPLDTPIAELTKLVRENRGVRSIYVEDDKGRIIGEVSLGGLIKAVTARRQCTARLSTRRLLSCITCQMVQDIMDKKLVSARLDEDIETVLMKFIRNNIKEMPVLDANGKIIKNIGVLDIWAVAEGKFGL